MSVLYDETIEYNDTLLFSSIDPAKLPLALINGKCTPIYPHMRLRTNTLFEVARSHGKHISKAEWKTSDKLQASQPHTVTSMPRMIFFAAQVAQD